MAMGLKGTTALPYSFLPHKQQWYLLWLVIRDKAQAASTDEQKRPLREKNGKRAAYRAILSSPTL